MNGSSFTPLDGFDPDRLPRAEAILREGIESGVFTGCAVVVGTSERIVWMEGYGVLEEGSSLSVTPDTLFDLASLTKPLACASSLLKLVEAGDACLTDEIKRFFPETPDALPAVTLRHLLTHTSGLPAWERLYGGEATSEETIRSLLRIPLQAGPGERYLYSDLGYILLGDVVRRASGKRIDEFAGENVFQPLGMNSTGYWAFSGDEKRFTGSRPLTPQEAERRTARTRNCSWREGRTLVAEVHDANCRALDGVSGHAGLFGTVEDVATYLQTLLRRGKGPEGHRWLSPIAVETFVRPQIAPAIGGQSLGWFTPPNGMHTGGDLWAGTGFSHSGFTGTSAWGDSDGRVFVVLLTNAVYRATGEHLRIRRRFHNAVAAARTMT